MLLLGAFSNCYAFSENDVKSLIYNTYVNRWNKNANDIKNYIDNSNFSSWNQYFNNDNYQILFTCKGNTMYLYCRYVTGKPYNVNNGYGTSIYGTKFVGTIIQYENPQTFSLNITSGQNNTSVSWYDKWYSYYTEFDIYESSSSNNKYVTAGSYLGDYIFEENDYNKTSVFAFQEVATNTHVKIGSDGVSMPLYYAPGSSLYFADFINDDGTGKTNTDKPLIGDALYLTYYTGASWAGRIKFFERYNNQYFDNNRYMNFTIEDFSTKIKFSINSSYLFTNCVYQYDIFYKENNIDKFITYYFYLADGNTTIVDSVIDPTTSIPNIDDYINNIKGLGSTINNNNNTDEIVDNINSGDNGIISALTNTDYNGDITSGDFITYEATDPTLNFFDFIVNSIGSIFLNNNESYLTLNLPYMNIYNYRISSDFFILTGALKLLINFIFIYLIIVPKINEIHEVIKVINMGYSDTFIRYFGDGISINDLL